MASGGPSATRRLLWCALSTVVPAAAAAVAEDCAAGRDGAALAVDAATEAGPSVHVGLLQNEALRLSPAASTARGQPGNDPGLAPPPWGSGFTPLVEPGAELVAGASGEVGRGQEELPSARLRRSFELADINGDGKLDTKEAIHLLNEMEDRRIDQLALRVDQPPTSTSDVNRTWDRCSASFQVAFDCTFVPGWEGGAQCGCGQDCHQWFGWCMDTLPALPTQSPGGIAGNWGDGWFKVRNGSEFDLSAYPAVSRAEGSDGTTASALLAGFRSRAGEADADGDGLLSEEEAGSLAREMLAGPSQKSAFRALRPLVGAATAGRDAIWQRCSSAFQAAYDCTFIPASAGGARCGCAPSDCHLWFGWCLGMYPELPTPTPGVAREG